MTLDYSPNAVELQFLKDLECADKLIAEAMDYSNISPNTAPVRYAAAEGCAKYVVSITLGLVDVVNEISEEYIKAQDRPFSDRVIEIRRMNKFRKQVETREIKGE